MSFRVMNIPTAVSSMNPYVEERNEATVSAVAKAHLTMEGFSERECRSLSEKPNQFATPRRVGQLPRSRRVLFPSSD